jgi:hypothetical protein
MEVPMRSFVIGLASFATTILLIIGHAASAGGTVG